MEYNPQISVDCVVFGFDGERLKVLLVEHNSTEDSAQQSVLYNNKKLPGSIIREDENLDTAAYRILEEYTGLTNIYLHQFKAFGEPNRSNDADVLWLDKTRSLNISRLVTVAYVALIKLSSKIKQESGKKTSVVWLNIEDYKKERLAFDHKDIISAGLENIRHSLKFEPDLMFELLPKKFTMSQLRAVHDMIYQKRSDVRNFQKRMWQMEGISVLAETEVGVPHRAARYFTFTKRKRK